MSASVSRICNGTSFRSWNTVKRRLFRKQNVKVYSTCVDESDDECNINAPRRILSGIQPTGSLHLGNYIGAIKRWVDLQEAGEDCVYSIADLHSITVPQNPKVLQDNILQVTATLIACGIDPDKCVLFQQSKVRQHTDLCWVLGSITSMAKLGQQTQLKEKRSIIKELPIALYLYPVLQAADILLYRATHVPVGEDQNSHLELAKFLARSFNKRFGPTMVVPEPMISDDASNRIKSLRTPTKKMSKSEPDPKSCIYLSDSPEEIVMKCKKAVTDFTSAVTYEPESRPGVSNLLVIHSQLTGKSIEKICKESEGIETAQYKMRLADEVIEVLRPIREQLNQLLEEPSYLRAVLDAGSTRAEAVADETWLDVRVKIGFDECPPQMGEEAMILQ